MNKSELIAQMAAVAGISNEKARIALDTAIIAIGGALSEGDDAAIMGFGTFSLQRREARTGRNPSTGEPIQIEASNAIRFKPAKSLRDAVN